MLKNSYAQRYEKDVRTAVYPVEFVVRAFLGTYPGLKMPKSGYAGKRVLDLGHGDGRNMPLLHELGLRVHGVEISEGINRSVRQRLEQLGVDAVLKEGSNAHIPFENSYFTYVLACHSCYYLEADDPFEKNLAEIARVMEPGGFFIGSLAMSGSYVLEGAKALSGGRFEIRNDPYGLRNGTVFRVFDSEKEIAEAFSPYFNELSIGYCDDLFWGIHQKVWIFVCRKK